MIIMTEEKHTCCGHNVNYMRGTPCGRGYPCNKLAKYNRDGKRYCGIHDPEKVESRRLKREQREKQKELDSIKTYGFKIGSTTYGSDGYSEKDAWLNLFGKITEIENLGELK